MTEDHGKCIGGLAQLARAPALQAGGQRFESVILHSPLPIVVLILQMVDGTFFDILNQKQKRHEVVTFDVTNL